MNALYGHRWTSAAGQLPLDDDGSLTIAGRLWANGLAGLTQEQVIAGTAKCPNRADPWPPSISEFKALCLGIPSFLVIRAEMNDPQVERSAFARLVWSKLDSNRWRQASADKADMQLHDAYDLALEHVMSGGGLPTSSGNLSAPYPVNHVQRAWETMLDYGRSMGLDIESIHDRMIDNMAKSRNKENTP